MVLPKDRPYHAIASSLGSALMKWHLLYPSSNYLNEAMQAFHTAIMCTSSSILAQFAAGRTWAHHAHSTHHLSALQAYQHVIDLLPHLASWHQEVNIHLRM